MYEYLRHFPERLTQRVRHITRPLPTQNINKNGWGQIFIQKIGFELAIPVIQQRRTSHALSRADKTLCYIVMLQVESRIKKYFLFVSCFVYYN
jgi:hypothetical protein